MMDITRLLVIALLYVCSTDSLAVPQYVFEETQPYVVVFKPGTPSDVKESHIEGLNVESFSLGDHSGYFSVMTSSQLNDLHDNPHVDFVEKDHIGKLSEVSVQENCTWALSSISHRDEVSGYEFLYDTSGGEGVVAYVVDSGIKTSHEEFEGRAEWITSVVYPYAHVDTLGHGTHIAGIIGSKTFGVAKNVKLKTVGISRGDMTTVSWSIKGIEVAVRDHMEERKKKGYKGSVMNLSIGFPGSKALDLAVQAAIDHGIHVAVAAGNDNVDACATSPARVKDSLCVGAASVGNVKADFSNHGPCVDIFAPGDKIESTFIDTKTKVLGGTSMASPHVAGLLAYYLGLYPEQDSEFAMDISTAALKKRILQKSTEGGVGGLDERTPNRLAYNGGGNAVW